MSNVRCLRSTTLSTCSPLCFGILPKTTLFDLDITNFTFTGTSIEALVNWEHLPAMPCTYDIFCFQLTSSDYYSATSVTLPFDALPASVKMMAFSSDYSVNVYPKDYNFDFTSPVAHKLITTPPCLLLANGNFSICEPGPPTNFQMQWIYDKKQVVLSWQPPDGTSPDNPIKKYFISVAASTEDDFNYFPYQDFFTIDKDALNTTVSNIRLSIVYEFSLSAISAGGRGFPARIQLYTNVTHMDEEDVSMWYPIPWTYILSCLAFIIILLVITLIVLYRRKRSSYKRGYPSGSADVPDYLRPYLLPLKKIELEFVVGKGEFGTVYKGCYNRNKESEPVAVKMIPAESISRTKLLHEVEILQTLGRHNIVGLVGFTLDVDRMCLVLEYCPLGNLQMWLKKFKKELLEIKRKMSDSNEPLLKKKGEQCGVRLCSYIHQIATGMEYISSMKMIHRDLATRNILLCSEEHVKIADFGLSRDVYETRMYATSKSRRLPIRWLAPEALQEQKFTTFTDVWAFGVVMWEFFKFGEVPYSGLSNSAVLPYLKEGYRLPKPSTTPQVWYDLMLECWSSNPCSRPTFKEIVKKIEHILMDLSNYTVVAQ